MFHPDSRRIRLGRCAPAAAITVLGAATAASGATAAAGATAATAATLHIRVPSHVAKGKSYSIELTGTFKPSEVKGKAYVISALQYSSRPCASTAQDENRRDPQFYFAPTNAPTKVGIFETKSPFTRIDDFTALRLGARRVCSYMYAKQIAASDKTRPIARAGVLFRVTKR
jgi:hypothetical protein